MTKPTTSTNWANGGGALITDPGDTKRSAGYLANEKPAPNHFNWLFNTWGLWIQWLVSQLGAHTHDSSTDNGPKITASGLADNIDMSSHNFKAADSATVGGVAEGTIETNARTQTSALILEERTDDSVSVTGRVWLRTDL